MKNRDYGMPVIYDAPVAMKQGAVHCRLDGLGAQVSELEVAISELIKRLDPVTSPAPTVGSNEKEAQIQAHECGVAERLCEVTRRLAALSTMVASQIQRLEV